jgi:hypothetical protein
MAALTHFRQSLATAKQFSKAIPVNLAWLNSVIIAEALVSDALMPQQSNKSQLRLATRVVLRSSVLSCARDRSAH